MKKILFLLSISIGVLSCTNNNKEVADNKVVLRTDTINVLKLTDTMVIHESTCRGCEFEGSTNFAISDSTNIIKLLNVITTDNNPADMNGGSIRKDLVLVPLKAGNTTIKLYKFWTTEKTAKDSARFMVYKIEVK